MQSTSCSRFQSSPGVTKKNRIIPSKPETSGCKSKIFQDYLTISTQFWSISASQVSKWCSITANSAKVWPLSGQGSWRRDLVQTTRSHCLAPPLSRPEVSPWEITCCVKFCQAISWTGFHGFAWIVVLPFCVPATIDDHWCKPLQIQPATVASCTSKCHAPKASLANVTTLELWAVPAWGARTLQGQKRNETVNRSQLYSISVYQ